MNKINSTIDLSYQILKKLEEFFCMTFKFFSWLTCEKKNSFEAVNGSNSSSCGDFSHVVSATHKRYTIRRMKKKKRCWHHLPLLRLCLLNNNNRILWLAEKFFSLSRDFFFEKINWHSMLVDERRKMRACHLLSFHEKFTNPRTPYSMLKNRPLQIFKLCLGLITKLYAAQINIRHSMVCKWSRLSDDFLSIPKVRRKRYFLSARQTERVL